MRTPTVSALVLAHFAALTACKAGEARVDAGPSVTATPITTASAPADPSGKVCATDADCGGGWFYCRMDTTADGAVGTSGHCVERPSRGRALVVDATAHVAPLRGAPSASAWAEKMRRDVVEEHASIAAFARTISELMALGAPSSLLEATARALADEIRHTEDTLAWAERLTGERWSIDALPAAVAPLRRGPGAAEELFRDVFRHGAIGETLAAAEAEQDASRGPREMHAFYIQIANEEARHAALAFATLRWLLARDPALAKVRDEETVAFGARATAEQRLLVSPLVSLLEGEVESIAEERHG